MDELSETARLLLETGAKNAQGLCCTPGQVRKNWGDLRDLERSGFVRFLNVEQPWITPEGRRAIGAPTETEATLGRWPELRRRKPLAPPPDHDPRTDFDYRSYRAMGWCCTLVVRQPDWRDNPATIKVGRLLTSEPQFLGAGNSIIQPESCGRFILAIVPAWMIRKNIFSSYPMPLDEDDQAFTAEERSLWDELRHVCFSINARIRKGSGRRMAARSMSYGHTA